MPRLYRFLLACLLCTVLSAGTGWIAAQEQNPYPATYTVQTGDTLGGIAARFGIPLERLAASNHITDVDVLYVGQVLNLPGPAVGLSALPARPGDTIGRIAAREGLSVSQLAALNRTAPTDRLWVGQPVYRPADVQADPALRFGSVRAVKVPQSILQGQAAWLQIETSRPLSLTANWNGIPLGIRPLDGQGGDGTARLTMWGGYVPAQAEMGPGTLPLRLSYVARSGVLVTRTFPLEVLARSFGQQQINLTGEQARLLAPGLLQAELDLLGTVWTRTDTAVQWRQPLRLPLPATFPTTSPYGSQRSYNGGIYNAFHSGQDFGAPGGTPVMAAADGRVALAQSLTVRGNSVVLDHGAGLFTGYWHLRDLLVVPGASVQAGDPIGFVGTTGLSTGDHLHWELRIYGIAVDPMPFLTKPLNTSAVAKETSASRQ